MRVVVAGALVAVVLAGGCGGRERREERRHERAGAPAPAPAAPPARERAHGDPAVGAGERRDDRQDAARDASSAWDKLGERLVQGAADRDTIDVGARDGRFTRVKLVVEHSQVELWDVDVVFADGDHFSPGTRLVFGKGTTSRVIDLPGGARVIRRVTFRYGNLPGGGRATVELWAK